MVRDLPLTERPRERLLTSGPESLSNVELLAILLRTGTHEDSVLHLAERVLSSLQDRGLPGFTDMAPEELAGIHGIGGAKAATVLAAVELGRRLSERTTERRVVIHGPEDAANYALPRFRYERREHFSVMLLNTKNHVLAMPVISIVSLTASIVHPREVFCEAIRHAAASMILFHNHPSGDPSPSREDIAVTERLVKAGKIMDIPVLDHIILGDMKYISLKEKGMVK